MEAFHIWVGTDRWQRDAGAERVLEHSIRKHATCPVEMHWMRSGDPEWPASEDGRNDSWNLGRPVDQAWPKQGWGTPFSRFRFAIPEAMGFQGRAVYMDADMLVLGDVAELLAVNLDKPWVTCHPSITDVSVIDCAAFKRIGWPSIAEMKRERHKAFHDCQRLQAKGAISATLPWSWNIRDSATPHAAWHADSRLLHYTSVPHQPWHPYPTVTYIPHPKKPWVDIWFAHKAEADAAIA